MDKAVLSKIYSKIESFKKDMIDLQEKLISCPAISPETGGVGEWEKARFLRSYMDKMGFNLIEEHNAKDERAKGGTRPNIIGVINGKDRSRTVWVMGHMDVVPEGDRKLWNSDPFKAKIEGDKIYGRGAEDNHQAIITALMAIKALKELKIQPRYNVGVLLVADEENGNEYGISHVLKEATVFSKNDIILVPDAGDAEGVMIEVAEKGILWAKFTTEGKQTHGSTPEKGVNAHRAASALVLKFDNLYKDFGYKDSVFDPPVSTFEPTKREANVQNINTIPGTDTFYMDCRILPKYSVEEVAKKMKDYCKQVEKEYKVTIRMETPHKRNAAPPTPVDSPVVELLKKAVKDVYGVSAKPLGVGGGTVAAFFRDAGYHAACWAKLDDSLHQPNEYCKISNMIGDSKVFANIFAQG